MDLSRFVLALQWERAAVSLSVFLDAKSGKTTDLSKEYDNTNQALLGVKWRNFGDEATLMSQKLKGIPIVVDENRYRGGLFLIDKFKPDIIILDDGFQHRSLERNCDIVLLNGQDQPADHKMIPYGNLREPRKYLNRADVLILTKTNLTEPGIYLKHLTKNLKPPKINSHLYFNTTVTNDVKSICLDENTPVVAVSGIAAVSYTHLTLPTNREV